MLMQCSTLVCALPNVLGLHKTRNKQLSGSNAADKAGCGAFAAQHNQHHCGHASSAMKHHNHVKALPTIKSQTKTSTMCTTKSGCEAAPGKVIHKVSVWAVVEAMEAAVVTSEDELETLFLLLVVIIFKEHNTPCMIKQARAH